MLYRVEQQTLCLLDFYVFGWRTHYYDRPLLLVFWCRISHLIWFEKWCSQSFFKVNKMHLRTDHCPFCTGLALNILLCFRPPCAVSKLLDQFVATKPSSTAIMGQVLWKTSYYLRIWYNFVTVFEVICYLIWESMKCGCSDKQCEGVV